MDLGELEEPIVLAPMAGGPSTVELAAAVCGAGGLGFLAAARRSPEQVAEEVASLRAGTGRPFGVNLFVPAASPGDPGALAAYAAALAPAAERLGVAPGTPYDDDDGWEAKLAQLCADPVAVVSFTFGCPASSLVDRLHAAGSDVWVSVTTAAEGQEAQAAGADALVVQGVEAGGHRASFVDDDERGTLALLPLLQLVRRATTLPLVAAGGIAEGRGVAAVLAAGASAAQVGTAFLRTPEAGTAPLHRAALLESGGTALTRAFSGRRARGLRNAFMAEHADAPSGYPQVLHVTAPLVGAARAAGEAQSVNLWAGEAHALASDEPAGALVRRLGAEARDALRLATARWG